jgi:hypothetical protein
MAKQTWFITVQWIELPSALITSNGQGQQIQVKRRCSIIDEHPALHFARQYPLNQSYLILFACRIDDATVGELHAMGVTWDKPDEMGLQAEGD